MKKPSSLAQQIQQAKKTIESWSPSHVSTLRLEGSDIFLSRYYADQPGREQSGVYELKENEHA